MKDEVLYVPPSAFGFLYDECRSCFYNEIHRIWKRPRVPFPTIFNTIDAQMKASFSAAGWYELAPQLPHFRIESQGRWVESVPVPIRGTTLRLAVRGAYDSILRGKDNSRALVDFKTSAVKPALVKKYARQLQGYSFALENPARALPLSIDRLGLLVFEPNSFRLEPTIGALDGTLNWLPIARDNNGFNTFLQKVGALLAGPVPLPSPDCPFCIYRYGNAA